MIRSTANEQRLVRDARAGEPAAMADLYEMFGATVYRVALRLMKSAADAEDVVQEVFLGLNRSLLSFEGRGSLEGWIKRVTSRTALMRLRRQRSRNEISLDAGLPAWVATTRSSPFDRLTLELALTELPDALRAVFVLKEIEGYTHQEIGEMLGIRLGTSKVRLYRARKKLQAALGEFVSTSAETKDHLSHKVLEIRSEPITLHIDPGNAPVDLITDLYVGLEVLNRSLGGSGIEVSESESRPNRRAF